MNNIIFEHIPVSFDRDRLMEENKIKPDTDLAEDFLGVIEAAEGALRCKAVLKLTEMSGAGENSVVLDGIEFKSGSVAGRLRGKKYIFLYVMTVGTEIDGCEDANYPVLGDIVRQAALDISMKYTLDYIKDNFGCADASFINPGTLEDWPVELNKTIFEMIGNITELTGAVMTAGGFMKPWYSSAGIIFS
jgi:hypothetical protein